MAAEHYSPYKAHNQEVRNLKTWDETWERFIGETRKLSWRISRWPNGHRTVNTQRALVKALRLRLREIDLADTGDNTFANAIGI